MNIFFQLAREAEVGDLDRAVVAQQHVAGRKVAVDALALHQMLHARGNLLQSAGAGRTSGGTISEEERALAT